MNQSSLLLVIHDSNTTVKQIMTSIKYNGFYGLIIIKQTYIRTEAYVYSLQYLEYDHQLEWDWIILQSEEFDNVTKSKRAQNRNWRLNKVFLFKVL